MASISSLGVGSNLPLDSLLTKLTNARKRTLNADHTAAEC